MFLNKLMNLFILFLMLCSINCYAADFSLNVSNLKSGGNFPIKFISKKLGGQNISPEVSWTNPPKNTKVFVLTCIDKNQIANNWVHWMLVNLPCTLNKIPEGFNKTVSINCIICKNSFGYDNYGGPQPPQGTGNHKYIFTLYALKSPVKNIKNGEFITEAQLLKLLQNKIISKTKFLLNRNY